MAALVGVSTLVLTCTAAAHDGDSHTRAMLGGQVSGTFGSADSLRGAEAFEAAAVPAGFTETTVWSGLSDPIAVRFSADGQVFVLEQGGVIKQFDSINDTTATVWADLSAKVHKFWDRGALGIALDPQFTTGRPFIYLLYAYDAPIGGTPPTWGDACPTPPGPTADGCVMSGRLSKVSQGGAETVLINDWCQQYPSHSQGTVAFGPDGALYASSGDGASFDFVDYGADGNPVNPCGDPPGGVGGSMTPPTAEGGALRSQDIRTSADPTSLDGAVIRVNPDTGAALPDNPNASSSDPNTRRIIAYGLRNPFRWAFRPGTSDIYLGDVGWSTWEEINRLPTGGAVENFGWPCYEGNARQGGYDAANVNICENLYSAGAGAITPPLYTYNHASKVSNESCPTGGSSISGVAFYTGSTFPSQYSNAMFFSDYSRNCIWVMFPGADGTPDPATRQPFYPDANGPVDMQIGPDGALWWVSLNADAVRRVQSNNPNNAPTARATATPTSGPTPLTVAFDGSTSSDPDGSALTYAWDLDGDGAYDDSTAQKPSFTYTTGGVYTVRLRVTDPGGATGTTTLQINAGTPPTATIDTPTASTTWKVDDVIGFTGHATASGGAALPASALSWTLVMQHCSALVPTSCHSHNVQSFNGASGSFTAPDHEYPAYLELKLTATDGALSTTVTRRLDPKTVDLTLQSSPPGASIAVGSEAQAAPFTRTVIQGSTVSLIADSPQTIGSKIYDFTSWSDGGARAHTITAPATSATYSATYTEAVCSKAGLVGAWGFDETNGTTAVDSSGAGNTGTISGATRTTAAKYGSALSFDGSNDVVTVPDANSLDLTTAATVSAWVNPTALGNAWRTAVFKAQTGQLSYALYAHTDVGRPSAHLYPSASGEQILNAAAALPLNTWTNLTMTWDGTTERLYVGGAEVASRAVSGSLVNGAGPLTIGGNGVWSEWFLGSIDDVRVYNRALTAPEVAADIANPVACVAGPPPPPQPVLSVSKSSLSFTATQGGADPAAQTVDVTNTGTGSLAWTATESSPWLAVTPASGTAPSTLTVTPSIAGLAPGTYTTAVTIAAGGATGSPKTVDVTLRVDPPPPPPALSVSTTSLSYTGVAGGASPAAKTADVTNTGGGTLSFTASDDQPWLSVTPASGTAPATLSVSINSGGLSAGDYTGTVTVGAAGASGSPKTIAVSLHLDPPPPPALAVSATSLAFTATQGLGNPAAQTASVTNTGSGSLSFTATDDQPWLSVTPGSGTAPATLSIAVDATGLAPATYTGTVTVTAAGATGSPKAIGVTLTVNPAPPPTTGLVGAWGFDETTGLTANDASGSGNPGTLSGPTRITTGRFGPALSFDGTNDIVNINDAASLDLSTALTLEAWVYPTGLGSRWRTLLFKEQTGQLTYGMYAHTDKGRPSGNLFPTAGGEQFVDGTAALPLNTWSHLAMTWDGITMRLFLNGSQVASRAQGGTLVNGARPLRIGGNTIWSEWFLGRIDEVRVYNRALTQPEVAGDMNKAVSGTGAALTARRALAATRAWEGRKTVSRRTRARRRAAALRRGYRRAAKLRPRDRATARAAPQKGR